MSVPPDDKKSWTMDDSTRASNPGQLEASLLCWFRHRPRWPIIWAAGFAGALLLTIFLHWSVGLAVAFFAAANFFYWMQIKEQFRRGCANPGVVVSLA